LNAAGVIAVWPLHAMPPVKVPAVWAMYLVVANAECDIKKSETTLNKDALKDAAPIKRDLLNMDRSPRRIAPNHLPTMRHKSVPNILQSDGQSQEESNLGCEL
jgi:hypothetical protein